MFCTQCGKEIGGGNAFCPHCGQPVFALGSAVADPQQKAVAQDQFAAQQQIYQQQPVGQPMGANQVAQGAYQAPRPARGCFGSGWDDVKGSQGWLQKVALMALINYVPILNWVNNGYALNWMRGLAFGRNEQMPEKVVNGDNFKLGFFQVVLDVVALLAIFAEFYVIAVLVPSGIHAYSAAVLFWLIAIILLVFAFMFLVLAHGRLGTFASLGPGFSVGRIMEAYKRKLDTLFCVTYVPAIVGSLIGFVIELVFGLIIASIVGGSILSMGQYLSVSSRSAANVIMGLIANGGFAIVMVAIIMEYCLAMVQVFVNLVTMRAVGHYVARYAPEWASEASASLTGPYVAPMAPVAQPSASSVAASVPAQQPAQVEQPSHAPYVRTDDPHPAYDTFVGEQRNAAASGQSDDPAGAIGDAPAFASGSAPDNSETSVLAAEPLAAHASPALRQVAMRLTRSNGQTCTLEQFPVVIGKGSEADLIIEGNNGVSRTHVRILRDGDVFAAEDLGSTNGTKIGSYTLPAHTPTILSDGDVLMLGNEALRVNIG